MHNHQAEKFCDKAPDKRGVTVIFTIHNNDISDSINVRKAIQYTRQNQTPTSKPDSVHLAVLSLTNSLRTRI